MVANLILWKISDTWDPKLKAQKLTSNPERHLLGKPAISLPRYGSPHSAEPLKICLFQAVVESVLMYGSETWTPTRALEIQLDGCYTRLLRSALNVDWRDHVTNEDLYGDLPRLSAKLRRKRLQFAGHCYRAKDEAVSRTVLWTPTHGRKSRGRPLKTYVDLLSDDTGLSGRDLETTMLERCHWRDTIFRDPRTTN